MTLEIVDAHPTGNGLAVTFVTDGGLVPLEGSAEEHRSVKRRQDHRGAGRCAGGRDVDTG